MATTPLAHPTDASKEQLPVVSQSATLLKGLAWLAPAGLLAVLTGWLLTAAYFLYFEQAQTLAAALCGVAGVGTGAGATMLTRRGSLLIGRAASMAGRR